MLAVVLASLLPISSHAATITWSGAGTDWYTAADWLGGTIPAGADIAEFNLVSGTQPNIGTATAASVGALWSATGVGQTEVIGVTGAGTLTIAGNLTTNGNNNAGIVVDNAGNYGLTINAPLTVSNNTSFLVNNASQLLIHGGLTITAAKTLTLGGNNASGYILIDSAIAATTGAVTVNTLGTVTLSSNNAYTGITTLLSGTLVATNSANALGLGTLTLSGGVLDLTNASGSNLNFGRNTTVNANTTIISDVTSSGAGNTYTLGTLAIGAQDLNIRAGGNTTSTAGVTFGTTTISASGATFDVGAGANLTLNTLTGAFNFWKQNAGTLTLNSISGTRATGATYVTGGVLVLGGTGNGTTVDSLGSAAAPTISLFNGTTLDIATGIAAASSVAAHPTTVYGSATILSDANTASTAGFTQTLGTLTILGADTLTIGKGSNIGSGTAVVAFGAATMNANTTFSVGSGAQLTLNSTLANGGFTPTFSGAGNSTVTGIISGGGGLTMNGTGLLTLTAANTYTGVNAISSGTVTLGNVASLGSTATAVLNMTGGTLNVAGVGSTLLSLNGNSSSSIISSGAATLTINPTANTTGSFGGNIGTGATALAVTVNGVGAMTLSGNNPYTGITTLTAGQLNINSNTAIGTNTFTLTTGIIDNTSSSDVTLTNNNNVTLGGNFTFGGSGNLSFGTGTLTSAATPKTLNLMGTGGKALTFGTWNNNIASAVTNIYTMPGSNSTVNFGKFISTSTATVGTIAGNANITITGGIQPVAAGGGITYSNAGTLTLSGVSNYTGATTLNAGTFILENNTASGSMASTSTLTLGGGALVYHGASAGSNQTLGAVTLAVGGASSVQVIGGSSGSTTLTLGTISAAVLNNSTINFSTAGTGANIANATPLTSGLITNSVANARGGAYTFTSGGSVSNGVITGGNTTFATITGGNIAGLTGQTTTLPTTGVTGNTTNYLVTGNNTALTGATTIYSLQLNPTSGAQTISLGGQILTIASGGLLYSGNSGAIVGSSVNDGTLKSSTATNSDLIIHNFGTGGLTLNSVIGNGTGTSVVTFDGPGTTTVLGTNTYSGITVAGGGAVINISADAGLGAVATGAALTLNNATLQAGATFALDNSNGTGTNPRAITLGAGGGTFDTQGYTLTVSGVISSASAGAGSLTKIGSGTLNLVGANTYTGGFTNIQNGTLIIGTKTGATVGNLPASTMVVLGSGANSGVLQLGDASNAAPVTVAGLFTQGSGANNAIVGGFATGTSTLTFGGSLLTPSTFAGTLGGSTTASKNLALTITGGALTLSGNNTYNGITTMSTAAGVLNINSNTAIGSGTLALNFATAVIDNTSGSPVTMTNNNNVSTSTGFVFGGANNLSFGTGALSTTVAATPISVWGSSTLTFGGLTNNVAAGAALTLTVNGSTGTLSLGGFNMQGITGSAITDTIAGNGNVNITGPITPGSFNAGNNLSYTGSGILTLSGSNTYTGLTTENGTGILKFGAGGSLNSASSLTLTAGALDFGGQSISITTFTATAGLVTSSASNGSITSTAIAAANAANFGGSLSANLSMATGALASALSGNFYNTGSITLNNNATAANAFTVSGASVAPIGNITFNANGPGAFTISAASLNPTGTITNSGTGAGVTTISGVIGTNVTSVTQNSATSMLALTGADLATNGKFIISSGTLQVGSTAALGTFPVIWDGGTFATNVAALTIPQLLSVSGGVGASNVYLASTNVLTIGDANNLNTTINGVVSGPGGLTLGGNGTLTLAGTTTYTGATTIATGTLNINGVVSGNTAIALSNGGLILSGSGALSGGTLTVTGGTVSELADYALSGSAGLTINSGTFNYLMSRPHNNTGTTTLTSGTITVTNAAAIANTPLALNGGTLALRSDANATYGTPSVTVGGATTIDVNQLTPGNNNNTLSVGLINLGAFTLNVTGGNGYSLVAGILNVTGNATLNPTTANMTFTSGTVATGATLTLGGIYSGTLSSVSGLGGVTFNNALGTLAITGTSNTYAGLTTLTTGILQLSNTGALAASSGLTVAGGTLALRNDAASPTFTTGASNYTVSANAGIDVNQLTTGSNSNFNIGTLNLGTAQLNVTGGNGDYLTVAGLNVTNSGILNPTTANIIITSGTVATGKTLTYSGLYSGTISNISGAGGVVINTPANTWAITGTSNTYAGATQLTAGVLQLSNTGALATTSGFTLSGGTLQLRSDIVSGTFSMGTGNVTANTTTASTIDVNQATGAGVNNVLTIPALTLSLANITVSVTGGNGYSLAIPTLTLTASGNIAPTTAAVNIGTAAISTFTLGLQGSTTGTIGAITGGAGLVTINAPTGTWTLTGTNTYTGATTVTAGLVNVTGSFGNTAIAVNGGTLSLQKAGAVYQNTVNVGANGTLVETVANALTNTAALTNSGVTILSVANNYTGNTTLTSGTLLVTNVGGFSSSAQLNLNGGVLQLRSDSPASFTTSATSVGGNATIDVNQLSSGSNQQLSIGAVSLGAFALTTTGGNGYSLSTGALTLTASGTLAPNSAAMNVASASIAANTLTLGGTGTGTIGSIVGTTAALTKNTAATWTLTGADSYGGATTVSAGALILSGSISTGATYTPSITVSANGRLSETVANAISGTTALTSNGGVINLSQANNFTGATTLSNGTLILSNSNAIASSAVVVSGSWGTVLALRADTSGTFNTTNLTMTGTPATLTIDVGRATSSGTGSVLSLAATSTGMITLNSNSNISVTGAKDYTLALPALYVVSGIAGVNPASANMTIASGTIATTGTLRLGGGSVTGTSTIGAISGAGMVAVDYVTSPIQNTSFYIPSSNTWVLSGLNTNTGGTYIGASTTGTTLVTGSLGNGFVINNSSWGATLSLRNANAVGTNTITISGALSNLTEGATNAITGNAALTISGAGALAILNYANNYSGATIVSAGALQLSNANAIASSGLTLSATGIVQLRNDSPTTFNTTTLTLNGGTVDVGAVSTSGSNKTLSLIGTTTGTTNVGGAVSFTGNNGDSLALGPINVTAASTLTPISAGVSIASGTIGSYALTLAGSNTGTIGAITGTTGSVTVNAPGGNWTLTGTNTYTGATTVTNGTANITGMMGNTAVNANGGTLVLGGSGAINQNTLTVGGGLVTETAANGLAGTAALTLNSGTVILNYANNTTGATSLSAGVLQLSNTGALAGSALALNGGLLQLRSDVSGTFATASISTGGPTTIDVNQAASGSGVQLSLGALTNAGQIITSTGGNGYSLGIGAVTLTVAGSIFNPTTANMNIASIGGAAQNLTLSGSTTGNTLGSLNNSTGTLTKSGPSTWTLTGSNAATGGITVNAGTLQFSGANGATATTTLTLAGGTLILDNTTAAGGNNNARIADTVQFNLSGGNVLYKGSDAGNSTETFGVTQVNPGYSTFTVSYNGTGTAILSGSSFTRPTGSNNGTALVNGVNLGLDSTSSASVARFKLVTTPTLVGTTAALSTGLNSAVQNTSIVPFLLGESAAGAGTQTGTANTFLTYNATTGLRPLDPTTEFTHASIVAGNNIYIDTATTASTTASINSLVINGGDLALGSGAALTDASGAILFVTGNSIKQGPSTTGTLAFGASEALVTVNTGISGTISAPITGANGLTKSGSGTLVLAGANIYTGQTIISAGTLQLGAANSLLTTGTLNVSAANTVFDLNGYNQTLGSVLNNIATAFITNSGAAATLTVGNGSKFAGGNLTGNLSLVWNQGATAENDTLTSVTNTGNITLNANGAGTIALTGVFNNTGNIYNSGVGTAVVTATSSGAGNNLAGIYQNSTNSLLKLGGTFGANAGLTINSGTVQASAGLTTGTNGLLTVNNSGVFDMNNQTVNSGLLSGASTTGTITNTGAAVKTLTVSGTTTANFAGVLAGKTNLAVISGTQILSGVNTYTGTTWVGANTPTGTVLQINGASAMNTSTGLTLGSGVIVALRGDTSATYLNGPTGFSTNSITATVDVNQLTSSGSNQTLSLGNLTGGNMVGLNITGGNGYTLGLGSVSVGTNGISINPLTASVSIASLTWTVGNNASINASANTNNFIGPVNAVNANGFSKTGAGALTLTGAYSGSTALSITGGTFIVGGTGGTITGGAYTYPNINLSGGTLSLQRANAVSSANILLTVNGVLTENVDNAISGTSALTVNGNGQVYLTNNNNNTGATNLASGLLQLSSSNAIGSSSSLTLTSGILRLRNDSNTTFVTPTTTIGGNLIIDVNQTTTGHTGNTLTIGNVSIGAFTLTTVGANGYALTMGTVTQTGAVTYTANAGINIAAITGATFGVTVGGGANSTIGNITTTTGAVTKNGAGTLTLNGAASTFTGAITINGGILNATTASLNGSNATNGITICSEGILQAAAASTGTISKAITLTGIGTFDLNGSATTLATGTISAGTFVVMDSGATPGTLTLSATNLFTSLYLLGGTTNAATANINAANSTITFNGGTLQAASGGIIAAKAVTLGNLGGVFDTNGNASSITGVISGPGALTKIGSAALTLSGANVAFGGGITINNGTVTAGVITSAFGQGNVTFGTSNTPTLDLGGFAETIGLLSGASTNGIVQDTGAPAALTLTGTGTASFAGQINNGTGPLALTKSGPGTQILNGVVSNGYGGTTTINGGVLKLDFTNMGTPTNLISGTTPLTMNGGTLSILGKASATTSQSVASLNASAGEDSIVLAPSSGTVTLTISSATVTLTGGATVNFDTSAGTPSTALVAWNPTLTNGLIGTTAQGGQYTITDNTGTGFATVLGGNIVKLSATATLGASSNVATTNFNTTPTDASYTSGTLTLTNAAHALNTLTIASGSGGTLDLGGNITTLNTQALLMTGTGNYAITDGTLGAAATNLYIHQFGTGTLSVGANISSGASILTKDGTGTLVLTASNSYSGGTYLLGGVTQISSASNLGAGGAVQLYGGTLEVTSAGFDLGRFLNAKNAGGTLQVDSGTLTLGSGIFLDSKAYLTIQGAGNLNITGLVSDTGVGGGLIFASSYTGVTTLSAANGGITGGIILNGGTVIATNYTNALGNSTLVNGLQMNGGTLVLSNTSGTGLTFGRNVAVGGNTQIVSDVLAGTGTTGNTYIFGTLAIGNNTLTVTGGTNVTSGVAGVNFLNTTLTGANSTLNIQNPVNGGTTLVSLNDVIGTGTLTLTGNGNFTQRVAQTNWIGTSGLTLDSNYTGLATLSGNNTFTGGLTIKSGTLAIGTGTTGAAGVATTLGEGTVYLGDTTGSAHNAALLMPINFVGSTIANDIVVQAGNAGQAVIGGTIPLAIAAQQTLSTFTYSGQITLNKNLVLSPHNSMTMNVNYLTGTAGIIVSASGLGVSSSGQSYGIGAGSVVLSNPNTYQGDTKVFAGVLTLSSGLSITDMTSWLGTSTNAVVLGDTTGNQAARINFTPSATATVFNRNFTTQAGSGGIANIEGSASMSFSGNITLNKTIYLSGGSSGNHVFTGIISDAPGAIGGMTVATTSLQASLPSLSNVTLAGNNTYDGGTIVGVGTVTGTSAGAFGLGNVQVEMGTVRLTAPNNLAANKTVHVSSLGVISLVTATFTQANLQQIIDNTSSGGLAIGGITYSTSLDMSQLGNGMMSLGSESASATYSGTSLGANSDGNYRIGPCAFNQGNSLTVTNGVFVDGTNGGNTHAQLIVGAPSGLIGYYRVGTNPAGYVVLTGTNTYSGGTTINSNSQVKATQATVAGASPIGSGPLTLNNAQLTLLNNGTSTVTTSVGALNFGGNSQISLYGVQGGINTLSVGQINRASGGALIIGTPTGQTGNLGTNVRLMTSGTLALASTTAGSGVVDTNGAGTANAVMVAPYLSDYNGNFLSYNATTGFNPIISSVITMDNAQPNSIVKLGQGGVSSVLSASGTVAGLMLGSGNILNSSNNDVTITVTSGGVNLVSGNYDDINVLSQTIGSVGATGHVNLDFNGQEGVFISNRNDANGNMLAVYNNIMNTGGNGISFTGNGQLTLSSTTSSFTGTITLSGRMDSTQGCMLKVSNDLQLGGVGAALNNGLTLNGAGLAVQATMALNPNRTLTIGTAGGYIVLDGLPGTTYALSTNLNVQGVVTGTGAVFGINASTAIGSELVSSTLTLSNTGNNFLAPIVVGEGFTGRVNLAFSDDRQLGNAANTVTLMGGNSILQYTGTTSTSSNRNIIFGDTGGGIEVLNNVTLTENGPISGSGVFNKNGNGTLALTASSSYVGSVIVNAGILNASNNYALGASDAVVTGSTGVSGDKVYVESTGELDLQNNIALGGAGGKTLYVSGTGVGGGGALVNLNGNNSNAGQVILQGDTAISTAAGTSLTLSGAVSGSAALTKTGAGTLLLGANNSYSGNTTVTGGTLNLSNSLALQNSTLTTGGFGLVFDQSVSSHAFTFGGLSGSGTLSLTDNGGNAVTLSVPANYTYSGVFSGLGSLITSGTGTLTLTSASTFSGNTTVSSGTLNLSNGQALQNSTVTTSGGSVVFDQSVSSHAFTFGGLSGSSGLALTDNGGNAVALTVATSGSTLYTGTLSGLGGLTKSGAGTTTLTAANTYNGATTVGSGVLSINNVAVGGAAQALGVNSTVNLGQAGTSSGILQYTGGAATLDKNINALGNGSDTIQNSGSGLLTLSGTLTKNGTVLAIKGSANGINVTGAIVGSNSGSDLVVDGGVTTLSGSNSYNGPTYIRNGATLNANVAYALPTANGRTAVVMDDTGSGSSTLAIAVNQTVASLTGSATSAVALGNHTLTLGTTSGSTTFSGVISGTGASLVKDSASTQILAGANTFSGATTVSAGTLIANNTAATSSSGGALQSTSDITVTGGTVQVASSYQVNNTSTTIHLNGGTFALSHIDSSTGTITEKVGALTLGVNSIIDMGTQSGGTVLTFAGLSSWASGQTLSIYNWTGTPNLGGGTDQIIFSDTTGISASQLSQVYFYADAGSTPLGSGAMLYGSELTAVPEPSTYIGAVVLLGLIGWRERRRISALLRQAGKAA